MEPTSYRFEVSATSEPGTQTKWTSQSNTLDPIVSSIPVAFQGPGHGYTPEDFLGLAVLNCLISTFKILCEKKELTFKKLNGKVVVCLKKDTATSKFVLGELDITFEVIGASDKKKAKQLLDIAMRDCPISNTIKAGKIYNIQIS